MINLVEENSPEKKETADLDAVGDLFEQEGLELRTKGAGATELLEFAESAHIIFRDLESQGIRVMSDSGATLTKEVGEKVLEGLRNSLTTQKGVKIKLEVPRSEN